MLIASLKRLESTIDAETEGHLAHRSLDQEALNRRKSQSLLELSRLVRGLDPQRIEPEAAAHLLRLKAKLERNQDVVGLHLRAVEEVSGIIAGAIQDAESDGTYSAFARR